MNNLEKYLDRVIDQKPAPYEAVPSETGPGPGSESSPNFMGAILRRWYIVLLVTVVLCGIGLPSIWFLLERQYDVAGAIRVAPIIPNILTGEADRGQVSNYNIFVNTQAVMITSSQVRQRVADDLSGRNLRLFSGEPLSLVDKIKKKLGGTTVKPEPANILKEAVFDGTITANEQRNTELIRVSMKSTLPNEARQIVNAFIRNYMDVYVSSSAQGEDQNLTLLENERKVLAEKLQRQRETLRQLANEYGTTALDGRQDMMLQRVTTLLNELTGLEARRINLEANLELLQRAQEEVVSPDQLLTQRNEYVNSDPIIQELTRNIVQLERDLIIAKQTLAPGNPTIAQKQELLDSFKSNLEKKRVELGKSFDEGLAERTKQAAKERLLTTQAEIQQIKTHEKRLREVLNEQDTQTIQLGRTQLDMEDLRFNLELDKALHDQICQRIQMLEMERKQPGRVSVAYEADITSTMDKRIKFSAALFFGSLFCGVLLAFLKDKGDQRLRTPEDVVKRIGIRIVGTTANSRSVKPALLPQQISGDYQTIRANLGLLDGDGMPKKLAVTSPGMGEGKTTFTVNLARSLAKSGKKVLVIDGDLRKPDVGQFLGLSQNLVGIRDVLVGRELDRAIRSIPSSGLDVLLADSRDGADDGYDLIASPMAGEQVNKLSLQYDHVIIDTPPVLAFPDALMWAKIAGSVVLISFAGQTTARDLREAKERLAQANVKVLGTVLSNVEVDHSYYRYGYNYYSQGAQSVKARSREQKKLLLPLESQSDGNDSPDTPS